MNCEDRASQSAQPIPLLVSMVKPAMLSALCVHPSERLCGAGLESRFWNGDFAAQHTLLHCIDT